MRHPDGSFSFADLSGAWALCWCDEGDAVTEREKMLAGELYDALDPDLVARRDRARDLCQTLNATREAERAVRRGL